MFADTGWEAPETYEYLDLLRARLGITIDVVRDLGGGMRARIRQRAGFPARKQRWCTRTLKIEPLRAYHDTVIAELGNDTTRCAMRIAQLRKSASRAKMPEWADDDEWGGYTWRPLIAWSVADVIAIHHRHAIPMNPLYLRGHDRVGCFPCVYANKEEIRLIAMHAPDADRCNSR